MTASGDKRNKETRADIKRFLWIIAFILILFFSFEYAEHANVTEYFYDSRYYWHLADVIFDNGDKPFNPLYILRFPKSVRGYFFPVLAGLFKYIFQGVRGWRVLASLSMAFCFSLSLPYALKGKRINSWGELIRTLLSYAVYMWVWGDLMQYPLSDFISVFLLLSSIAFFRAAKPEQKVLLRILLGLCAGIFLYAAYNTRPTFLYSGILVLIAFVALNRRHIRSAVIVLAAVLAGMAVIALPQCHINRYHEGVYSPKVFYDLVESEVYKGLDTARYETYVGDPEAYRVPGVAFVDNAGSEIIRRENLTEEEFRLNEVFRLFLKYPLDMTGIYFRHFISLLTPAYRHVYLTDVYTIDTLCIIATIIIWLIAFYGILVQITVNGINWHALWILAVCIPGLLQIFDEPELRFFLPIYLLGYYYVFVMIDYKQLGRCLKPNWFPVLVITAVVFLLWLSLTGTTLGLFKPHALLLGENPSYLKDGW